MSWEVVYEKAIKNGKSIGDPTLCEDDLFFKKLSVDFLRKTFRSMGSWYFAQQYMNEVIPEDEKKFKKEWLKYHTTAEIPKNIFNFGFIDPAIGQTKSHDYTAITVISTDVNGHWWVRMANRFRLTPTEIIQKFFELHALFKFQVLGVEAQAFQEALVYFGVEEMKRQQKIIPLVGIKRTADRSKEMRILSLEPRFRHGLISIPQGLIDFESEYASFPRASHDDILDSLQSIEEIVTYPQPEKVKLEKPHSPHDPKYEEWIRQNLYKRGASGE